ncbi:MAG: hypothetical protein HYS80_02510 [Candidatus Aenigmarchaeota archaeon]|nr:hypothetical protein [Candidatus Aenigmarchaeota archaeon]
MIDLLITSLNFIGFLGFVIAFVYSVKNFRKTQHISSTWLMMAVATMALALFAFLNFLEWSDILPEIMDEIQDSILPIAVVIIATSVLVSHYEFLKPVSR